MSDYFWSGFEKQAKKKAPPLKVKSLHPLKWAHRAQGALAAASVLGTGAIMYNKGKDDGENNILKKLHGLRQS